jgi:hypothetical protein
MLAGGNPTSGRCRENEIATQSLAQADQACPAPEDGVEESGDGGDVHERKNDARGEGLEAVEDMSELERAVALGLFTEERFAEYGSQVDRATSCWQPDDPAGAAPSVICSICRYISGYRL